VIGGGIVGLAVARELTIRRPGLQVTVFDKEDRVAAHQSGHNSGVVHAGIYYAPGSLKARLCVRGGSLLREFCQQHDVRLRELGKLVVASSAAELGGLAEIERRALANGVPGVRRVAGAEIAEIEPYVRGVAALHSPHTASVDFTGMCQALVREITSAGGALWLGTHVRSLSEYSPRNGMIRMSARHRVRGMVYPVPDPRYPFLGVHLTRDVDDGVHVGPNAVLALALEGYRWRDVRLGDLRDIGSWPGTWRLIRRHWRNGIREMTDSLVKRRYLANVRTYLPQMQPGDLVRSTAGVRAQAVRRDGGLVDDFVLRPAGRVMLVRNAPSPAATSSLAIAEHIVSALSGAPATPRESQG